ncbi:hypothetical protein [Nitrosococcus oceani]|uniref:Uncharacterized protein n=1 Tax=Nitrosococcus oceani C-27 TaxID=314279 RepID=A0A0E2Z2H2_9GAMM|nr:hypothetical protein [Nitrosococcus oceani]KFI19411.1 hypothetical protein IB75_08515 [Nitrosococcus oceani C-27]KFI22743.1 hypothetical protein HW44_07690 [Nitrosococcus oceani]GEM21251.1 hypothetical protein NONS58_26850 [Nitrosococcus oceani]
MKFIKYIGPMRIGLALFTLALMGMAPFASGENSSDWGVIASQENLSGWDMIVSMVAPSLTVIMFFVLSLDMMMNRIFMTDTEGPHRLRYRRVLWLDFSMIFILLLAWGPFFADLLRQS